MALNPQNVLDAVSRISIMEAAPGVDRQALLDWLNSLPTEVAAAAKARAGVSQTGTITLAATDRAAVDEGAGTFSVNVPAASTLGDPWRYDMLVTSGSVSFVGGQATVPVAASGGGVLVRLYVVAGKVYLLSGTGATATRVA